MPVIAPRPSRGLRAVIAAAAALATVAGPSAAWAFHSYSSWDEPPLEGGAGSVYFIGLPSERGWDCTMCHENPPRRIRARVTSEPPELAEKKEFTPGALHKLILTMEGETLGARANVNSMSFALINSEGALAALAPPTATAFSAGGQEAMKGADNLPYRFTDGLLENATRWEIEFYAPCTGGAELYFGMVDGNGAADPASKNQDPQGDDVVMGHLVFKPNGAACPMAGAAASTSGTSAAGAAEPPRGKAPGPLGADLDGALKRPAPIGAGGAAFALVALGLTWRLRRERRTREDQGYRGPR